MPKGPLTDRQIAAARKRGAASLAVGPVATSVIYDRKADAIALTMRGGATLTIPRRQLQGLSRATSKQLATVYIDGPGTVVAWDQPDIAFTVEMLVRGVFGGPKWMSELARQAARAKSPSRAATSRRNGLLGGRPPKKAERPKKSAPPR